MSRAYALANPRQTTPERFEERKAITMMGVLGFSCWHLSQSRATRQTPGWPDMLFTCPEKRLAVYYEAKGPNGKQSAAQKEFQRHVEAAGAIYVSGTADVLALWCEGRGLVTILPSGAWQVHRQ